jgi:hypothetical protein
VLIIVDDQDPALDRVGRLGFRWRIHFIARDAHRSILD